MDRCIIEEPAKTTLGKQIRFYRERMGITQSQLSLMAGVSRMTMWRWESGAVLPHSFELDMVLTAMQVSEQEKEELYLLWEQKRIRAKRRPRTRRNGVRSIHFVDHLHTPFQYIESMKDGQIIPLR
ncbi:MAG: helix-turn-helix transcriptional regulator [bacterium]